jgi:hypothetical protein
MKVIGKNAASQRFERPSLLYVPISTAQACNLAQQKIAWAIYKCQCEKVRAADNYRASIIRREWGRVWWTWRLRAFARPTKAIIKSSSAERARLTHANPQGG